LETYQSFEAKLVSFGKFIFWLQIKRNIVAITCQYLMTIK